MNTEKIKLFLVDDDPFFLNLIQLKLQEQDNFTIETFTSAELCISNLIYNPDVVILDYQLDCVDNNTMSGLEALDKIKEIYEDIPVVILSSLDKVDVAIQCMHHKAYDYVVKSETATIRLQKIITSIIDNRKKLQKVNEAKAEIESVNRTILDYQVALDESSIVSITNKDGIIQHVNDNFCKLSKYTKEELIGADHRIVNSGYHSKEFFSHLWQTIAGGNIWRGNMKNKAKDGTIYWVDTTIVPFLCEKGKPTKYLAIRSDTTESKKSFEELKANEEKYRNLYENNLVALYTVDMDTLKAIDVNKVGLKLFGYKSKIDFLANFHPSLHYSAHRDRKTNRTFLISKGEVENKVQEMKKLDGTTFWANIFIKINFEKNTSQTVIIDITQQVNTHRELKVSEEKYKGLFENSLVAMLTYNRQRTKPISVNNVCVRMFGYKSKIDFINNFDPVLHLVNISDQERIKKIITKKGELDNLSIEFKKKDGTHFWTNIFVKINSDLKTVQIVITEITQQIRFQEELEKKVQEKTLKLNEALLREKSLNEMKSRFVTNASHEFRTPLSTILSSASLIELYTESTQQDNRLKHISRIYASIKNLTDILTNFLSLGELEKGIVAESSIFNLPEFLSKVIEEMDGIVNEKNQVIKYYHIGEEIIEQPRKIVRSIVLNLLSNASKYSEEQNEINITSHVDDNIVYLIVKDNGIGIPEEDQNKLFNEFFRAGNVENIQGTGLGLSIVKKYTELINGSIKVCSKENSGTTFTVTFPQ